MELLDRVPDCDSSHLSPFQWDNGQSTDPCSAGVGSWGDGGDAETGHGAA